MKLTSENTFVIALILSMAVLFVVFPLGLPVIGVGQLDSLAVAILGTGVVANSFLMKFGFSIGNYENNPVYEYARRFLTPDRYVVVIAAVEAAVGLALFAIIPDQYLVLLIALYALSGVLYHSIELATR